MAKATTERARPPLCITDMSSSKLLVFAGGFCVALWSMIAAVL